jgi:microcystin-dependent protein
MAIVLNGTTGITTPSIDSATVNATTSVTTPTVDTAEINAGNMVGEVCFFAMSTAPSGFLKANGAAVSRTTYAALFTAIGTTFGAGDGSTTFLLPDLRGEFVRGWADGRAVDTGRAFGSAQLDQMQRITGSLATSNAASAFASGAGALSPAAPFQEAFVSGGGGSVPSSVSFNSANSPSARVSSTTDGETRSRNVALLACIKF